MQVGVAVFLTFAVTLVFLLIFRPVAVAIGLVDVPGGRKTHDAPVPVIGGICMSLGLGFGAALFEHAAFWDPVLLGIYLLVVVGTIDDRFDVPPHARLFAQTCAALLVVYATGARVTNLGEPFFFAAPLGALSVPFTLLFIMTLINAFNMTDGIDGLAGGLALISLGAMAFSGVGPEVLPLVLLLMAAVGAFMISNLPLRLVQPIRTFMGDAGSTFIGLSIATVGVWWLQGPAPQRSPVIGLWLVAVPVFDLLCSIVRRVREGKSPLRPDCGHLHHVLIANGLSRSATLVVILSFAAACAAIGIAGALLKLPDGVMLLAWFAAGIAYHQLLRRPAALIEAWQMLRAAAAASVPSAPR
jgi:UDP-GlcNAc:undecaprenyl-phosphate GlcNAc-1-phosphate transferase